MTNDTNDGGSQAAPQASYGGGGAGESGAPQDAPFPPLDFPGAEGLQGATRRRLMGAPVVIEAGLGGALGTYGGEIVQSDTGQPFVVVYQCVEQSELFPNVCNRWVPVQIFPL